MGSDGSVILPVSIIMWVRGYLQVEKKSTDIPSYLKVEEIRYPYYLPIYTSILSKNLTLHTCSTLY
jgi:hypothetical protein